MAEGIEKSYFLVNHVVSSLFLSFFYIYNPRHHIKKCVADKKKDYLH